MEKAGSGVGCLTFLTIVFIVLKLTGVISWSWLWVLFPLLISVGFSLLALIALAVVWIFSR